MKRREVKNLPKDKYQKPVAVRRVMLQMSFMDGSLPDDSMSIAWKHSIRDKIGVNASKLQKDDIDKD